MTRKHRWCKRCEGLIHVGRPKGSVHCRHCETALLWKTFRLTYPGVIERTQKKRYWHHWEFYARYVMNKCAGIART